MAFEIQQLTTTDFWKEMHLIKEELDINNNATNEPAVIG